MKKASSTRSGNLGGGTRRAVLSAPAGVDDPLGPPPKRETTDRDARLRGCAILEHAMIRAARSNSVPRATPPAALRHKKLLVGAAAVDSAGGPDAKRPSARQTRILRAVIEELARFDYGGLTFERVAARAGVNKTTVYRHWQTKTDLVRAALSLVLTPVKPQVTTGTLRSDLTQIARHIVEFTTSFEGQSLIRLHLLQHPEPELAAVGKELQAKRRAAILALGEAAVARGELSRSADFGLILDMLGGALHAQLFIKNEPVDDVLIAGMVDILMRGVGSPDRARAEGRRSRARGR